MAAGVATTTTTTTSSSSIGLGLRRQDESEIEFNLREWGTRGSRIISRENSSSRSRRFSGSHIRSSFREAVDATRSSFRSNVTVSSTASSPGYSLREEIDPSTYSFTTALKALQARTMYSWEYMSGDGLALNSKWNEAEKYICNPNSGEVPLECLSAKSLTTTTRSFRNLLTSKITMSAPLIYPSSRHFHTTMPSTGTLQDDDEEEEEEEDEADHEVVVLPISSNSTTEAQEKKKISMTRDIGTQSTPPNEIISSGSPSPAPTPSIQESPRKLNSPLSTEKFNSAEAVVADEAQKEEEITIRNEGDQRNNSKALKKIMSSCKCRKGGCLSWSLWMRKRQTEKHRQRKKNIFFHHVSGC